LTIIFTAFFISKFFLNQYFIAQLTADFNQVVSEIFVSDNVFSESFQTDFQEVINKLSEGKRIKTVQSLKQITSDYQLPENTFDQIIVTAPDISDQPYQGIYLNNIYDMRWTLANIDKVKQVGFNTILLEAQYLAKENGDIYVPGEEVYLFYINAFHQSGFRIWLTLGHTAYEFPYRFNSGGYVHSQYPELKNQKYLLPKFEPHILEWAEIAEKFQVDGFIPSEEINTILLDVKRQKVELSEADRKYLDLWHQRVLEKVKKIYHGKIGMAVHLSPNDLSDDFDKTLPYEGADYNYSGYDLVLVKIPFSLSDTERETIWQNQVEYLLSNISQYAREDGVSQIIWYEVGNPQGDSLNPSIMGHAFFTPEDQQKAYEVDFDIASKYPNLSLFFKISLSQPNEGNWNPFGLPAEKILEENFASRHNLPVGSLDHLWIRLGEEGLKSVQLLISDEVPFDPEYSLDCGYEEFGCKYHELEKKIFGQCRGYICPW